MGNIASVLEVPFEVPAHEILAHRILWSFIFALGIVMIVKGEKEFYEEITQLLRAPKK